MLALSFADSAVVFQLGIGDPGADRCHGHTVAHHPEDSVENRALNSPSNHYDESPSIPRFRMETVITPAAA